MIDRNADVPEDKRIDFRIGVNLGDIIADGRDIYGDGVNIAARLEALAEPGGICISRVVRDQIRDKLTYPFEDMGEQTVKNIARPVRAYLLTELPRNWSHHGFLAGALCLKGDIDEARTETAEMLKLKPEVTSVARLRAILATMGVGDPRLQALREKTVYAGLRRAGFPED